MQLQFYWCIWQTICISSTFWFCWQNHAMIILCRIDSQRNCWNQREILRQNTIFPQFWGSKEHKIHSTVWLWKWAAVVVVVGGGDVAIARSMLCKYTNTYNFVTENHLTDHKIALNLNSNGQNSHYHATH